MSYNGSGTFNINSTGQPVVAGTVITASAFNALTTDLATGLTTAMTKDGQTTTTARIPFAQGISSTLTTDATNTTSGSIITAGGVGIAKALYVGTNANVAGTLDVTGTTTVTNPVINNIKMGYTTTATAAGTTTLTVSSNYRQFFTGTSTQTIVLPVTSTLVTGIAYEIENNSTGLLTVNSSGGNLVGTVPAGVCAHAVCIGTTLTTAADWDWDYISTTTITGTGANVLGTSPTITTPTISSLSSAAATALTLQSAGTTAITVDTSQNVGIGVTPSAYNIGKTAEIGFVGNSIFSATGTQINVTSNAVYNSAYLYGSTNAASRYMQNGGTHSWFTAPSGTAGNAISFTQAMTLDSSGRLLVGSTSAYDSATFCVTSAVGQNRIIGFDGGGSGARGRFFVDAPAASQINLVVDGAGTMGFVQNATEMARFDSSRNFLVGKTSANTGSVGVECRPIGLLACTRSADNPLTVNRTTDDGTLVSLQQDGTPEGTISVSGTTVSYNGGHLSRYAQTTTAKDESLVKGTVLSNLDAMNVYTDADGNPVANEQLNKVKVSNVEGDANVAGVFVNWAYDEQHSVDEINMAMTGDMIIRIAQGVTVQRGDLLMSAGDGTAKTQGDDIVRSKTIAKVTSNHVTCTYADGSYCVPCVLMAC